MTVEAQSKSSPEILDINLSEEDIVRYVYHRKDGDPVPSNVIVKVNPFSIGPSDACVDNWYLCTFEDSEHAKGCKVRTSKGGYWKQKGNDEQIYVNSQIDGRKISWQFFRGNEPSGDRTAWMILEYQSNNKDLQDENDKQRNMQGFNSLCRIYHHESDSESDEPCSEGRHVNIDDDENDAFDLEARLLAIHNIEENNSMSESAKESQVMVRKAHLFATEECYGDGHGASVDMQGDDCSDYISVKDFVDGPGSPSSFGNSSRSSEMLDDCYESEALLLSLGGDVNFPLSQELSAEVSTVDNLRTDQLVDGLSLSVPALSSGDDVDGSVPSRSIGNDVLRPGKSVAASRNLNRVQHPASPLSLCIPSRSTSKSVFGEGSSRQKRAPSRSSDGSGSSSSNHSGSERSTLGSGSPGGSGRSSGGSKIKRLGKYCCFRPF